MQKIKYLLIVALLAPLMASCDSFLEYQPKGVISGDQLATPERVEKLVNAAYASLGNDHWTVPYGHMWAYGSIRSDDAYKGGGGTSDQGGFNKFEQFTFLTPSEPKLDQVWFRLYKGISRANRALSYIDKLSEEEYPAKTTRQAEMRFIRGHFYFLLKILFKRVPWIDETVPQAKYDEISNVALSSQELWGKIAADFRFAAENLPVAQPQVGRADKFAAKAYLAKTLLYKAYEQNERHQVVDIHEDELQQVVQLVDEVIASGRYSLFEDFRQPFLWEYEDGPGHVFAVQRSHEDGTPQGRVGMGVGLNYPMGPEYGCCWFHIPSQNLVNAFRTGADGLPLFETFNQESMNTPEDFQQHTFDPRLDHTVAIPTHPFKYTDIMYQESWARVPQTYGVYSTMKELVKPDSPALEAVGPFFASSKNTIVIRYADVLLWKAEALIELGRHHEALPIINKIRKRARSSKVFHPNGDPASNYHIELYKPGVNINWTQENARKALRWERRLEFAMEGSRFFDLVRWGVAAETLNAYFAVEKTRHDYLQDAHFTEGRDEYFPIPQQQIRFSGGLYEQNTGWPGS